MRLIVLFILLGSALHSAHAEAQPWLDIGSDDIRYIQSPVVDAWLRINLIDSARESIDIAVYDLRPDAVVTFPILSALRRAADRGVKVRFLTSYTSQLVFDQFKTIAHYLLEPATTVPIDYLVIGGEHLKTLRWSPLDTVHEKIFLVDHRRLLTTGRGIGENYLHWLDTDFAIKGALSAQAERAFNDAWKAALGQHALLTHSVWWRLKPIIKVRSYDPPAEMGLEPFQQREFERLVAWFKDTAPAVECAARARTLHHDFLNQLESQPVAPQLLSTSQRVALLSDPVVDALIDRLRDAREARLSIYILVLHPRVREAIIAAAAHGTRITVLTNIQKPNLFGFPKLTTAPGGVLWDVELPDLDDLLAAGVDVRAFQVSDATPWVYLHRKLAVVDDAVILGSHNFNLPSTTNNDEISFEVENPVFAAQMRAVFDRDLETNSMKLDAAYVHARRTSVGERILDRILTPFIGIL